jgi:hypothetical protein
MPPHKASRAWKALGSPGSRKPRRWDADHFGWLFPAWLLISPILFPFVPGRITRRWADQMLWVARTLVTRRTGYWSSAGIGRVAPAKAALLFKEQPIYEQSALWRAAPIAKKLCCSVK